MLAVAKDIGTKNLTIDFNFVLGQQIFFELVIILKILESAQKCVFGETNNRKKKLISYNYCKF